MQCNDEKHFIIVKFSKFKYTLRITAYNINSFSKVGMHDIIIIIIMYYAQHFLLFTATESAI